MRLISFITAAITIGISLIAATPAKAETTYLVIGLYTQDVGKEPKLHRQSGPNMKIIPMESTEQCETAGAHITEEIFNKVKYYDGQWTCIVGK